MKMKNIKIFYLRIKNIQLFLCLSIKNINDLILRESFYIFPENTKMQVVLDL